MKMAAHDTSQSEFDEKNAYAAQEEGTFFDDGREEECLEYVKGKIGDRGDPPAVLKAIDEYGRQQKYLMNVGEDKGRIVTSLIQKAKPSIMLELGGYCGYSTILFGSVLKSSGGKKYYSLERSPKFAKVIESFVRMAGLDDIVEVVVGSSDASIRKLYDDGKVTTVEMMFLDHYKPAYLTDLKLCESLGLIKKGTVLAADNVIKPGNPPYLSYVRSSVLEKKQNLEVEQFRVTEREFGRTANQYGEIEKLQKVKGNPNLIYESRLVHSFEPTGVPDGIEITTCLGVESD